MTKEIGMSTHRLVHFVGHTGAFLELRHDQPRVNSVDANALRRILQSQVTGQVVHSGLAGGVCQGPHHLDGIRIIEGSNRFDPPPPPPQLHLNLTASTPTILEMLMMFPLVFSKCGSANFDSWNTERTLTLSCRSNSSTSKDCAVPRIAMPALLTCVYRRVESRCLTQVQISHPQSAFSFLSSVLLIGPFYILTNTSS